MDVLLSIKPKFVDSIFNGQKKYEYRKNIFRRDDINKIIVYASNPTQKIVGELYFDPDILFGHPQELWRKTAHYSGVSEKEFFTYFSGKETGYAIRIIGMVKYHIPIDPLTQWDRFIPPQSFTYLSDELNTSVIGESAQAPITSVLPLLSSSPIF